MSLIINPSFNPSFTTSFAFYFGSELFSFQEKNGQVLGKIQSFLTGKLIDSEIGKSILDNNAIPESHRQSPRNKIEWLLNAGYKPSLQNKEIVFIPPQRSVTTLTNPDQRDPTKVLSCCNRAIDQMRQLIARDEPNSDKKSIAICPITHELFKDPVNPPCGHPFERWAIEAHIKNNNSCPTCRLEPATPFTSSLVAKQLAEMIKETSPIPLLPIMQGKEISENLSTANRYIKLATEFDSEGNPDEALSNLKKAFKYTNSVEHFELLPPLYMKLKVPDLNRAVLAYLYLAKRQIEENQFIQAQASLNDAFRLKQEDIIQATSAYCAKLNEDYDQASQLFHQLARTNNQKTGLSSLEVLDYWEQAFTCSPAQPELYDEISRFICDEHLKINFFISGFFLFTAAGNQEKANALIQNAHSLQRDNVYVCLAQLNLLREENNEFYRLCGKVGKIFSKTNHVGPSLYYLEKAAGSNEEKDLKRYGQMLLKANRKDEAEVIYHKRIKLLSANPSSVEKVIQEAMKDEAFGRKPVFLEKLVEIYLAEKDPGKLLTILQELASLYEDQKDWEKAIYRCDMAYTLVKKNDFAIGFRLANYVSQVRPHNGAHYFHELAETCDPEQLTSEKAAQLASCIERIKYFDPNLSSFSELEQKSLQVQSLSLKLFHTENELKNALAVIDQPNRLARLERMCIGKEVWSTFIGDPGEVSPLPEKIHNLLLKGNENTHYLIWRPQQINGTVLTLNTFNELVKKPKDGPPTQFQEILESDPNKEECEMALKQYGDVPFPPAEWIYVRKTTLEESFNQDYPQQLECLNKYSEKIGLPCHVATIAEAIVALFMVRLKFGEIIFGDLANRGIYCAEDCEGKQVGIGEYVEKGLLVMPESEGTKFSNSGVVPVIRLNELNFDQMTETPKKPEKKKEKLGFEASAPALD